jgi:hypothetical protein
VYFALAGFVPFTLLLAGSARNAVRRLGQPGGFGFLGAALSLVMIAALSAIDTGFVALVFRSVVLALRPPG